MKHIMKHKVGDVVQIKSLNWYKKNKDEDGWVEEEYLSSFGFDMSEYCGMKAKIALVLDDYYVIDIDNGEWCWCDYMFEEDIPEDMVNNPPHYTWLKEKCGVEVIDITRHFDFDLGNSLKYIMRAGHKHDSSITDKDKTIQDLEKAIFYLNDEINLIKNNYG